MGSDSAFGEPFYKKPAELWLCEDCEKTFVPRERDYVEKYNLARCPYCGSINTDYLEDLKDYYKGED